MLKAFKASLLALLLIPTLAGGAEKLVFYPGHPTLAFFNFKNIDMTKGTLELLSLPRGIDTDSLDITYPQYNSYVFKKGVSNTSVFFNDIRGRLVQINNSITGILLDRHDDTVLIEVDGVPRWMNLISLTVLDNKDFSATPKLILYTPDKLSVRSDVHMSFFLESLRSSIRYYVTHDSTLKQIELRGDLQVENGTGNSFQNVSADVFLGEPPFKQHFLKRGVSPVRSAHIELDSPKDMDRSDPFTFELSGSYSIPSNGITAFPIFSTKLLKASELFRFYTKGLPVSGTQVYPRPLKKVISSKNELGFPLGAGEVLVYSNENLVGRSNLRALSRQERFELGMGSVTDLKGKKEILKTEQKGKQFVNRYKLTVTSFKLEPVEVEIVDTLDHPYAKITESSHTHTREDDRTVVFKLTVPHGKSVEVTYTLTRPQ